MYCRVLRGWGALLVVCSIVNPWSLAFESCQVFVFWFNLPVMWTSDSLLGSCSYQLAVDDQKLLFPRGLCCLSSPLLHYEGIHCPAIGVKFTDDRSSKHTEGQHSSERTKHDVVNGDNDLNATELKGDEGATISRGTVSVGTNTDDLMTYHDTSTSEQPASWIVNPPRSLKQTACILFPPQLVQETRRDRSSQPVYVEMIRGLVACGFCPVAMKTVWLSEEEVKDFTLMMECGLKVTIHVQCTE